MNLLIADDHALFLDTLNHYIQRAQPRFRVVTAPDLKKVIELLNEEKLRPDLCILDFKMPGMKGHDGLQDFLDSFPHQSFAIMSGVAEPEDVRRILSMRVMGFLPKTLPGRVLLQGIDVMISGRRYIPYLQDSVMIMPSYASNEGQDVKNTGHIKFTLRERDVLKLLCEGKSNRDIADTLGLKTVTIKLHIRGIFRKMECDNRTMAALKAREMGVFL